MSGTYGIITIGREYCTGGLDIARAVAGQLGVPLYDKELITLAAKESGLSEQAIVAGEKRPSGSLLYNLYTLILRLIFLQYRQRIICGAIIHANDLYILKCLTHYTVHALAQIIRHIVNRKNN